MRDDELVDRIVRDWTTAGLDERWVAMLRYADKVTRSAARVTKQDVDGLRAVGFADADILAIVEVTGYYAFANRVVDALGVELEDQ